MVAVGWGSGGVYPTAQAPCECAGHRSQQTASGTALDAPRALAVRPCGWKARKDAPIFEYIWMVGGRRGRWLERT
jgi:hypothetical protein